MFDREGNRKYLNWPEREAFFAAVKNVESPTRRAFCLTLFYSGCRISEALELTVARIDTAEQVLVFRTLKRRKECYRSVPVPDTLIEQLLEITDGKIGNERVWDFSRTTGYRLIRSCMEEAGLSGVRASPKALRHGFAIACITRNVPLTTVKKWLGHARLKTTAIYLEVIGEEERELAKRVWKLM